MKATIESLKAAIRAYLNANCDPVAPKTQTSRQVHLEVWKTRQGGRVMGLEFGHDDLVNIWVTSMNIPPSMPEGVLVTRKTPKGSKWTDADGKGANSNLSGYDDFRSRPIARLGITSIDEAQIILAHLSR